METGSGATAHLLGSLYRSIDIFSIRIGHLKEGLARGRVEARHELAVLGVHELAINKVLQLLHRSCLFFNSQMYCLDNVAKEEPKKK
jgi:hypothetical protein